MIRPNLLTPFYLAHQLTTDLDALHNQNYNDKEQPNPANGVRLPGYPGIAINDGKRLVAFLESELNTNDLDRMAPKLWMMSTFSSANINTLHHQRVKGRSIIVTESPGLHLVWGHDCIFVKPMPTYLMSHAFWTQILIREDGPIEEPCQREHLLRAARGFLRTYFHLIKYESDFYIAQEASLRLVPAGISWEQFCSFSSRLDLIDDDTVNPRYTYGELRLTRLNFYAKFLLRRFQYQHIHGQYSSYFGRFYAHLLFAFGVLSILLNAIQVELAIDQVATQKWASAWIAWRVVSTVCLVLVILVVSTLLCFLAWIFGDEWIFAIRSMRRKRSEKNICSCTKG